MSEEEERVLGNGWMDEARNKKRDERVLSMIPRLTLDDRSEMWFYAGPLLGRDVDSKYQSQKHNRLKSIESESLRLSVFRIEQRSHFNLSNAFHSSTYRAFDLAIWSKAGTSNIYSL